MLTDNHVILCNRVSISVWTIPFLYPVGSNLSRDARHLDPVLRIDLNTNSTRNPTVDDSLNGLFLCLNSWYITPASWRPFHIDYIPYQPPHQESKDGLSFDRYYVYVPGAGPRHGKPEMNAFKLKLNRKLAESVLSMHGHRELYKHFDNKRFLYTIQTSSYGESTTATVLMFCEALDGTASMCDFLEPGDAPL